MRFAALAILVAAALIGCGDDTNSTNNDGGGGNGSGGSPATGGGGGNADGFQFADDPYDAYEQIDRHAAPEAGTAGIEAPAGLGNAPIRDDYNASDPIEDVEGAWVAEITESVTQIHGILDDDLVALNLVPATVDEAIMQAAPVIVPDTIKFDPFTEASFPNGRRLEDPVVDITLAAVLLKLGPNQPLTLFADLPLNPPANDVAFKNSFPYLADPHPAE